MTNHAHICVENLNVRYGNEQALSDIAICIPKNKITAIIGPSGCGKSTLLRSFNRLLETTEGVSVTGRVLVNGKDIYDPKEDVIAVRKKMGLLSQKPYPLPMSIYDNVAYGPRLHGVVKRKTLDNMVKRYLKLSSLWSEVKDRLHDPASRLSIGQQQRLCLARGLAVEPEIILGDEPTSALDPQASQQIEQRFTELKTQYTIVIVTHILRQARRIADYLIFLYLGKVIEYGPVEQFFENPKEEMTKEYIKGIIS
ncbi:MAG: phosphate ABC transporter ATP-binding protein [candidate division KSB1 bacterium]|jgi:phosphate transport system ATP-binding protein|nr:phosphate ABC transporter ATP-binding protein [candidate division KSB1 bacterium]